MLNERLRIIKSALNSVQNLTVYHYHAPKSAAGTTYCIWAEDGEENSFYSDNRKSQRIHATVDLYTQTEYDSRADDIQEALEIEPRIDWSLNSVQYEDETGYIHMEWSVTVA